MAKNIIESGIVDGQVVFADQILQITDALRGDDAYNINLTGSISINDVTYPTTDGGVSGSVLMTDGSGTTGFGLVQSVPSASYALTSSHAITSSLALNALDAISSSYAVSASHAGFSDVALTSLDFQITTYTSSFTVLSTNYTFTHNLNFKYVVVQAYDTNDVQIIPSEVKALDENNTFVRFADNQNGTVVIQA